MIAKMLKELENMGILNFISRLHFQLYLIFGGERKR